MVITDATLIIQGLKRGQPRRKNLSGDNSDSRELIYEQLDAKDPGGRFGFLEEVDDGMAIPDLIATDDRPGGVAKVKSHITWEQCLAKRIPFRHMILNEVVDRAAGRSVDYHGQWDDEDTIVAQNEVKLRRICRGESPI